jgi:hypothetical protein
MGKTTTKQGKGAGSKSKAGCKSQAQKAKKWGLQSQKHRASGSDDAVSSDPKGPSTRPKKKGKHVDISDNANEENEEEIDDAVDEVELVESDPESEPEPVSPLCY